jgi:SAM-dependent methyltransferase
MSSQTLGENLQAADNFTPVMKQDWDERARENAKWYINTVRLDQSEEEFDATGLNEIKTLILPELVLMTEGRDPKELKFLEIGCGIGRMTKHLAGIFGEVHATDVSGEMIRQARERIRGLPNIHLHETSGVDFAALPDGYFDVAFSAYVFQHVPGKHVIVSNIREAYRVLKPGAILRVHTNGVEAQSYAEAEKNTWAGATFTEPEIRQLARELGARLISVYGANTKFCWTMMRKPKGRPLAAVQVSRIEFHARADNAAVKAIPTGGDDAWLALVVSGLDREWVDANNVTVNINGQATTPRYVGRVRPHFEQASVAHSRVPLDSLVYIETAIPAGTKSGKARVSVTYTNEITSPDSEIELVEAQPATPKIVTVRNGYDYQTDIYASGPKSLLRLFVEGLDETANCSNVKIKVGEWLISPTFVGFVTDIAGYQVDAQLPDRITPGAATMELLFRGIASEAVAVELKS